MKGSISVINYQIIIASVIKVGYCKKTDYLFKKPQSNTTDNIIL